MESIKIENMLTLEETIAKDLFEGAVYPWEVLPKIGEFIKELGKTLPEEKYEKRGEDVWVAKSATVYPSAYIQGPVIIDEEVLNNIKSLTKLVPLHHPGEIAGIESMQRVMPNIPQVAVFDTAFHQTMPKENYMYALPYSWYEENGVRKYGFHGTSHKYITEFMQQELNKENVNLIICHIGSGASICCVKDGKSYNTTMGLTPLDGLVMGTRCGDIDPAVVEYICKKEKFVLTIDKQ